MHMRHSSALHALLGTIFASVMLSLAAPAAAAIDEAAAKALAKEKGVALLSHGFSAITQPT